MFACNTHSIAWTATAVAAVCAYESVTEAHTKLRTAGESSSEPAKKVSLQFDAASDQIVVDFIHWHPFVDALAHCNRQFYDLTSSFIAFMRKVNVFLLIITNWPQPEDGTN